MVRRQPLKADKRGSISRLLVPGMAFGVSQQIIKAFEQAFRTFFYAVKSKKFSYP